MRPFDTFIVADWSAARGVRKPGKDAIWIAVARDGALSPARHFPTRLAAEAWLCDTLASEIGAGRRVMAAFDFPFGYPAGVARRVTGSDDPFALWDWLAARITDDAEGRNNRFEVAAEINLLFPGTGPFWGKHDRAAHPEIPFGGRARAGHGAAESRACDLAARAASSVWQLAFPPTVGGQALMGIPMLARLRQIPGVAVWPFEPWAEAPAVLSEIWPGLIEDAIRDAPGIRDVAQVEGLARALSRLPGAELAAMLAVSAPEEGWILGAGHASRLTDLARPGAQILRDDCFALPPGVDWTPVDTALETLRAGLSCVVTREEVALDAGAGRILAEDLIARHPHPPAPNSAVDGWGFAHAGLGKDAPELAIAPGRAAAGAPFAGTLAPGHALRVLTGAILPAGVDTVVLDEDATAEAGRLRFGPGLKAGANTRKAGEDVAEGAVALPAGRVLGPADLALAASVGHGHLPVRRRLRVGVLSTGDELVDPGTPMHAGRIADANRPMLLAIVDRWGHESVDLGRAADTREAVIAALGRGARDCDAILTSGGASAGDEDHLSAALGAAGTRTSWRIALKPGRPLALGLWQGVPVFGLPGNPVAAFTCALIFARPALAVLAGADWARPQGFDLPAAFEKRKKPGRREYLRARIRDGRAEVFRSEGSGRVSGLAWADGFVELAEPARHVRPGDPVRFLPFGSFGL